MTPKSSLLKLALLKLVSLSRLWRITEIVNGFLVLEKEKHESKIEVLERELKMLRKENDSLRSELNTQKIDLNKLDQFNRL